jgi:hypothetical protein
MTPKQGGRTPGAMRKTYRRENTASLPFPERSGERTDMVAMIMAVRGFLDKPAASRIERDSRRPDGIFDAAVSL